MVTIQDTELKEGILEAIKRAGAFSEPILVSEVHKLDHIDPLSFFASGRQAFFGERFYWKDPSNETILAGLGICKLIQSDQASGRFSHVEKEWKRFIRNAVIYNEYSAAAAGPALFGGFSFDPEKEKTALWSKYPDSLFHVPRYLLTQTEGQTFLTTNIVCTKHDDVSLAEKVREERRLLLEGIGAPVQENEGRLISEEEIHPQEWMDSVTSAVEELKAGKLKKVVLARELRLSFSGNIEAEQVLGNLHNEQNESFIFAFESQGDCFIGASPERLVKKKGKSLYSTCLAGSIPRGKTPEDDQALGEALLSDEKNLIEHQYVVDMIKTAMDEACEEIKIPSKPQLLKMKHIQHLYTPVEGTTKEEASLLLLVEKLHPTPALGGLPKQEAVAMIREIEELDRGYYAGPLGWIDYSGNGEFAVSIRSGLLQGDEASLFAGCGIVENSNAESEFMETKIKFRPMRSALGGLSE
ncbi:isochorismate synthase [Bacillus sp. AG4(2022)]|uniref:isochorismate synthase n=1 Tax=Bacillus sp. AG4(2022) TaxID=2962594 RepID=UPI002881D8EA|nr:isochorismate synthase [Bacillus sp. AG4(2022)]MDT0161644.1 isochorismate synthase [Bacillus sp. AG4(2022)]